MSGNCRETSFKQEDVGVKITAPQDTCCEDQEGDALVYYNGLYCHPGSANFSAHPTGLYPPCTEIPTVSDPLVVIPDPVLDAGGTDGSVQQPAPTDPVISDPPPVIPPADEPPPAPPPPTPTDPTGEVGGDTTVPDNPDPAVDPTPVPTTTTLRYPVGMWASVIDVGAPPLGDCIKQNAGGFPTNLAKARATGSRVAFKLFRGYTSQKTQLGDPELDPASSLYDPTQVVGGWNLRRMKEQLKNAQNLMPDPSSYVTGGEFVCQCLADDITSGAASLWNGRVPTGAELDEAARYAKLPTKWSKVPTAVRAPSSYLKSIAPVGGYKYLDLAWDQLGMGGSNILDPLTYWKKATQSAKDVKLGIMLGGNLLDGGGGPLKTGGWSIFGNRTNLFGMSPTEINRVADAVVALGNGVSFGFFFWTDRGYYPSGGTATEQMFYFLRSDIQAALTSFKNKVKGLKIGPVNYR